MMMRAFLLQAAFIRVGDVIIYVRMGVSIIVGLFLPSSIKKTHKRTICTIHPITADENSCSASDTMTLQ